MRTAVVLALGALALGLAGSGVHASECILDHCEDQQPPQQRFDHGDAPSPPIQNDRSADDRGQDYRRNGSGPHGASQPGQFDFYVLSLSWSPGFCATGGDEKGRDQCRTGADIGFTVHGLWPQYDRGYPSDCRGSSRFPSRGALAETDGVYPDEGLARYEWRKHGTCSGLSPNDYFAAARRARDMVVVPPQFKERHESRSVAPADVERAFTDANPRLRPGMLAAICQRGTLDEVRFCFSKDLKGFQACPEVVREGCHNGSIAMPPVR